MAAFMGKCGKICWIQAGHGWEKNKVNELCWLDTQGCRHTLRVFNIYCFSPATLVSWTRVNVTFMRTLPVLFSFAVPTVSIWLWPSHVTWSSSRTVQVANPRPLRHVLEVTAYPDTFPDCLQCPAQILGSKLNSRSHVRNREFCQRIIDSSGRDCQVRCSHGHV